MSAAFSPLSFFKKGARHAFPFSFLLLIQAGCAPLEPYLFGLPESQWNQLSEPEKQAAIEEYYRYQNRPAPSSSPFWYGPGYYYPGDYYYYAPPPPDYHYSPPPTYHHRDDNRPREPERRSPGYSPPPARSEPPADKCGGEPCRRFSPRI